MRPRALNLAASLSALSLLVVSWGCARAHSGGQLRIMPEVPSSQPLEQPDVLQPTTQPTMEAPASQPAMAQRLERLQREIAAILARPEMVRARVSLLAVPLAGGEPLLSVEPDAHRLPASNAKLLTTVAAALVLPGHRYQTRVYRRGRALVLEGNGDPILRRRDLVRLAARIKQRGIGAVRGIIVDDGAFSRRRLAPGFDAFGEGAYYRPTSSAVNVDGNAIVIKVSAPKDRRRPRVDVFPPSDYVKVRKLVKFSRGHKGPDSRRANISVSVKPRGNIMWLTVSGTMGRRAPEWSTRRAVYDPSLNAGWAFRRALVEAGIQVQGVVRKGARPAGVSPVGRYTHGLEQVLAVTNRASDNLCAETLVRTMGCGAAEEGNLRGSRCPSKGSWSAGLNRLREAMDSIGVTQFFLGNGSGLHRRSWVTAGAMVQLLLGIRGQPRLYSRILATLPVAGQSGTLGTRMRHSDAEGIVHAKTGTLSGALALSGYIAPEGENPLAFSLLVNGRSDRVVRDLIDQIVIRLARHARGLDPEDPPQPTSAPATGPDSAQ